MKYDNTLNTKVDNIARRYTIPIDNWETDNRSESLFIDTVWNQNRIELWCNQSVTYNNSLYT